MIKLLLLLCFLPTVLWAKPVLSEKHIQDAENFKKRYFYDERGCFSQTKLNEFTQRLRREEYDITKSGYKTKIIDKIELEVKNLTKAEKAAEKQYGEDKNEWLFAYNKYLIPTFEKINRIVHDHGICGNEEAESVVDQFLTVYGVFYVPTETSTARNAWGMDYNHPHFIKNVNGYRFKRKSSKYVEASNLIVSREDKDEIEKCLGSAKEINSYLSPQEILRLDSCNFDISRLNPAENSFNTKNRTLADVQSEIRSYDPLYPTASDKIYFDGVKYSGRGSPKFKAFFTRGGKTYKLKIKSGREVHSEVAVTRLAMLLGFNQDLVRNYHSVKVYLGKTSISEFRAMFFRKYPRTDYPRIVEEQGTENGEDWIILKDALVEAYDPNLVRVGPYDFEGWDRLNKREHRAEMLFLAWLAVSDAKSANYRAILKKTEDGLVPLFRLHDTGYSLDRAISVRKLDDIAKMINANDRSVNIFSSSCMSWDEGKVHIFWGDVVFRNGKRFATTTYNDLKWMARKIASVPEEAILWALKDSRMPDPAVDLYYHKLRMRRNDMVKGFELEKEIPLFHTPNLKKYSPNEYIKHGKLAKTNFEGHNEYEIRRNKIYWMLLENIAISLPIFGLSNYGSLTSTGAQLDGGIQPVKMFDSALIPGVKLVLGRHVVPNVQRWNNHGEGHGFVVEDTFEINIGAQANLLKTLSAYLPVGFKGSLGLYRTTLKHIHFADSRAKAYGAPFKLLSMIKDFRRAVVTELNAGELIRRVDTYGLDLSAEVSARVPYLQVLRSDAGVMLKAFRSTPINYYRDHFSVLHVMQETGDEFGIGASFNALDLNLMLTKFPLLGFDASRTHSYQKSVVYSFPLGEESNHTDNLTQEQREREYSVIKRLKHKRDVKMLERLINDGDPDVETEIYRNYSLNAETKMMSHRFGALGLATKRKIKNYSKISFSFNDDKTKELFRYVYSKRKNDVMDTIPIPDSEYVATPSGDFYTIEVEMQKQPEERMGVFLRTYDYIRKTKKKEIVELIEKQNQLFSVSAEKPFYSDFSLPTEEETNEYRKVFAQTTIYLSAAGVERIQNTKPDDYVRIFAGLDVPNKGQMVKDSIKYVGKMYDNKNNNERYMKYLAKLLYVLRLDNNGTHFLKTWVGEDNLFVYGEIFGLYRSFTMLQRTEMRAGLRFAANHWGRYDQLLPIRKFLKEIDFIPRSIFVPTVFSIDRLFGSLPIGEPPMY